MVPSSRRNWIAVNALQQSNNKNMTARHWAKHCAASISKLLRLLALCAFISSAKAQSNPAPPNIIVILADDLGYGDVSYNPSNHDFLTPNIDSLTINGVQFTSGYVTHPFCTPTRAALLTGRYQQRFGVENLLNQEDDDNPRLGLPITELILPQLLGPAGYVCGLIGKWHLGTAPSLRPNQRGFDYFYGFLGGEHNYWNTTMLQNLTRVSAPGLLDRRVHTAGSLIYQQ